ncbi:phosphodiester glycosidase family protein [Nostoc sp. CHAB 5784]|uniref:phosphodiester glycosidase family protein n=1 Tax=Nostoc mirabile TaxID=2907820 RepID=UPI001E561523|nr:phosphodiester glycosidase family protein [Nostoc mirabile]MCC5670895.1 phosphodiester glycosidase family protein [Nostoc mirabile CHAB5784]
MNWKARLLIKIITLYLVVPFSLLLAVVESLISSANQQSKETGKHYWYSLPLGKPNLRESRVSNQIARGVTHTIIVRGEQSDRDVYTVDVTFQASQQAAQTVAKLLKAQGYQPRLKSVLGRAPDDPEFGYYRFGVRRNPRTLAGISARGTLLLVTVDGRQPGKSVGASFEESARIMRSLGATDALNLDGGGSTTLTINQQLINRPSDSTGERPIADAIIIQNPIETARP